MKYSLEDARGRNPNFIESDHAEKWQSGDRHGVYERTILSSEIIFKTGLACMQVR